MSTAADYIGRKFDVFAFAGATAVGDRQLQQTLFDSSNTGSVCTGIQKLAQRWIIEFFTAKGAMGFNMSTRGSSFMRWLRGGYIQSELDVRAYFNFAAQEVSVNLSKSETSDMLSDERLQSASLDQLNILDGSLELMVTLKSVAGDTRKVVLPINLTPANLRL